LALKKPLNQLSDRRFAGVKLTLLRNGRTSAVHPKPTTPRPGRCPGFGIALEGAAFVVLVPMNQDGRS
jgi:hypothetical protein